MIINAFEDTPAEMIMEPRLLKYIFLIVGDKWFAIIIY